MRFINHILLQIFYDSITQAENIIMATLNNWDLIEFHIFTCDFL